MIYLFKHSVIFQKILFFEIFFKNLYTYRLLLGFNLEFFVPLIINARIENTLYKVYGTRSY